MTLGDRCERHRYGFADQRVSYDDGTAVCDPALLRVQPPGGGRSAPLLSTSLPDNLPDFEI